MYQKIRNTVSAYLVNQTSLCFWMMYYTTTTNSDLSEHDIQIVYIRQLAVPRCLRKDVLRSYRDSLAGGAHQGFERTYRGIQLKSYWPGMYQDVADYIISCNECQFAKRPTHHAPAPLTPMPIEERFLKNPYGHSRPTYKNNRRPQIHTSCC